LLYGAIGCIIAFATALPIVIKQEQYDPAVLFLLPVSGLFGLTLTGFLAYHTWLILRNTTTLENMEATRYHHSLGHPAQIKNPFNRGLHENWRQIFGSNWIWWFLPVKSTPGNGHVFPYSDANGTIYNGLHSP
jgi:hypothetical protein